MPSPAAVLDRLQRFLNVCSRDGAAYPPPNGSMTKAGSNEKDGGLRRLDEKMPSPAAVLDRLHRFLNVHSRDGAAYPPPNGSTTKDLTTNEPSPRDVTAPADVLPHDWESAARMLRPLLAAAVELKGVETVGDALSGEVVDLARRMGISADLESIRVKNLIAGLRGPISVAVGRFEEALLAMSSTQRVVIEYRLLREPQATLAEVASLVGVTRERIRQIQIKLDARLAQALGPEMLFLGSVLHEEFGPIVEEQTFDRHINAKLGTDIGLPERLFRKAIVAEMGYTCQHGTYIDEHARSMIAELRSQVPELADDVGLIEERLLLATLPDENWQRHWPLLRRHTGLHELHGSLAIRDSAKARAKAALVSIGRAATREEIASMCGLNVRQTAGAFSNIPSVVKSTKDRWALNEWVDDEYEGIVAEIIQRIDEDGGSTTTERLLTELPKKFDVSANSVRAYMQTPRFVIRDDQISLANALSVELRLLDDAAHGRDADGALYWTFIVEPRFFDGYSVTGVPPEFAKALGCEPEGGISVRVDNLPMCRDLSVHWHLASTTGASLGYVTEALQELGLQPGQSARVTLKGRHLVELSEHRDPKRSSGEQQIDAILKRMKNRRRVL